MKMTFAIPDDVSRRFRKAVPAGERSAVVTEILRKKLRPSDQSLAAVCRRVNKLAALEEEMTEWERFDDQSS
jgi:predicted nucleic acid-binding protein